MQKYLMDPLALKVLNGEFLPGDTIQADAGPERADLRQGGGGQHPRTEGSEDGVGPRLTAKSLRPIPPPRGGAFSLRALSGHQPQQALHLVAHLGQQ